MSPANFLQLVRLRNQCEIEQFVYLIQIFNIFCIQIQSSMDGNPFFPLITIIKGKIYMEFRLNEEMTLEEKIMKKKHLLFPQNSSLLLLLLIVNTYPLVTNNQLLPICSHSDGSLASPAILFNHMFGRECDMKILV